MRWIYHPDQPAKVVEDEELEQHYKNGWYDTPAKFPSKEVKEVVEIAEVNLEEGIAKKRGRTAKSKELTEDGIPQQ